MSVTMMRVNGTNIGLFVSTIFNNWWGYDRVLKFKQQKKKTKMFC